MTDKVTFYYLLLCWFAFALIFFLRRRPARRELKKREPLSLVAICLAGAGYAIVWGVRRAPFSPMFPSAPWTDIVLAVATLVIAAASLWMTLSGVRTLGKQWSLPAELIKDHQLVTEGPYAIVRHPIYTGMLGMMLATGLVMTTWPWLLVAMAFGCYGTRLRIRSEERLLREAFGAQFEAYAASVPALTPRLSVLLPQMHADGKSR